MDNDYIGIMARLYDKDEKNSPSKLAKRKL